MSSQRVHEMVEWADVTIRELGNLGVDVPPMPPFPQATKGPAPYTPDQWCDRVLRWYGYLVATGVWPLIPQAEVYEAPVTPPATPPPASSPGRMIRHDPYNYNCSTKEVVQRRC